MLLLLLRTGQLVPWEGVLCSLINLAVSYENGLVPAWCSSAQSSGVHAASGSWASCIPFLLCWRNDLDAALYNRLTDSHLQALTPPFPLARCPGGSRGSGHPQEGVS